MFLLVFGIWRRTGSTKIFIFVFRDNLVPKYKSLQVSVTTESPDLSLSETLLSFMYLVRVINVVVWYIEFHLRSVRLWCRRLGPHGHTKFPRQVL